MNKQTLLTVLGLGTASAAFAQTSITPANFGVVTNPSTGVYEITGDLTLTAGATLADSTYILEGLTFVNAGNTITIEPGVVVRGQPRDGTNGPGALCVSRGAEIIADASASNPIIFTTAADVNGERYTAGDTFMDADPKNNPMAPNVNLWGALVLLGYAPTNTGSIDTGVAGEAFIEGFVIEDYRTTYGGLIPNDSSGILDYVSIRYSGDATAVNSETQGLTVGGVGYGTQLTNIEIYGSGDDGIEIFGGTAALKNIAISYVDDDGLDMDQGYTGLIQFAFLLASGLDNGITTDNVCEWDGDDCCDAGSDEDNFNDVAQPTTHPTIYNATIWGSRSGDGNPIQTIGHAVRMRRGWGGQLNNSIIANFRADQNGLFEVNNDSAGVATFFDFPSQLPYDQMVAGTFGVAGTMWFNVGDNTAANVGQSTETTNILNATGQLGGFTGYPACTLNRIGGATSDADPGYGVFGTPGTYNQTIANGLNPVPTPAGNAQNAAYLVPYTNLFFDEVNYAGAFAPDAFAALWTTGWTALNTSGVLVDNAVGQNL